VRTCLILFIMFILNARLFGIDIYFDAGIGSGFVNTSSIIYEPTDYNRAESLFDGIDYSTRIGYYYKNNLVFVADLQRIYSSDIEFSFKDEDSWGEKRIFHYNEIINSTYIGMGLIYYISSRFQTGLTAGYSYMQIDISLSSEPYFSNTSTYRKNIQENNHGIGFDLSAAYDIPLKYFGILLGARFYYSTDSDFINSKYSFDTRSIGLFIKIRK